MIHPSLLGSGGVEHQAAGRNVRPNNGSGGAVVECVKKEEKETEEATGLVPIQAPVRRS